ncbi:hypothetical protein GQ55_5G220300 [Panicum hallii var. hallii]|uniref:Uncharacterized protein n=1 Tax=Panicum hallii var. hallii TaxID=1504633 RepID=A0A2T7DIY4_9POAL|nr:hypothetical protein GQ55_5G220300 [Panicum hallii var. hallii]
MWRRSRERRRAAERQRLLVEDDIMCLTTLATMGDEDNEERERVYVGSVLGRRTIPRNRYSGYMRLMEDYFVENPVYGETCSVAGFE